MCIRDRLKGQLTVATTTEERHQKQIKKLQSENHSLNKKLNQGEERREAKRKAEMDRLTEGSQAVEEECARLRGELEETKALLAATKEQAAQVEGTELQAEVECAELRLEVKVAQAQLTATEEQVKQVQGAEQKAQQESARLGLEVEVVRAQLKQAEEQLAEARQDTAAKAEAMRAAESDKVTASVKEIAGEMQLKELKAQLKKLAKLYKKAEASSQQAAEAYAAATEIKDRRIAELEAKLETAGT
eukprot:TRINITY_DN19801_c0_g1_i1.p1 TRINITY_DN19801_c0_g1~~TRINITY_DN19801_c0_g1_i1.p1  ORF type:complete len:246 (-),score=96.72 TRINITY_DN19801_c0_g1_i1:250-987(-)